MSLHYSYNNVKNKVLTEFLNTSFYLLDNNYIPSQIEY